MARRPSGAAFPVAAALALWPALDGLAADPEGMESPDPASGLPPLFPEDDTVLDTTTGLGATGGDLPDGSAAAGAPAVQYINFSDGTTTLTKAGSDDATTNTSLLCGAAPFPAYKGGDSARKVTREGVGR